MGAHNRLAVTFVRPDVITDARGVFSAVVFLFSRRRRRSAPLVTGGIMFTFLREPFLYTVFNLSVRLFEYFYGVREKKKTFTGKHAYAVVYFETALHTILYSGGRGVGGSSAP